MKKTFEKGTTIFHEGDICEYICVVIKGLVTISSLSQSAEEIIYNIITESQMFGNNLLFSSSSQYKGDVICKEESTIIFINKKQMEDLLQNNKDFLLAFLKYESDFSKELNHKIKILSLQSAKERLMYLFSINNRKIKFVSTTLLAKNLFLSREATSRLISSLLKEGTIVKQDNYLMLK